MIHPLKQFSGRELWYLRPLSLGWIVGCTHVAACYLPGGISWWFSFGTFNSGHQKGHLESPHDIVYLALFKIFRITHMNPGYENLRIDDNSATQQTRWTPYEPQESKTVPPKKALNARCSLSMFEDQASSRCLRGSLQDGDHCDHLSCLGPQSTPTEVGCLQRTVSIEFLEVKSTIKRIVHHFRMIQKFRT